MHAPPQAAVPPYDPPAQDLVAELRTHAAETRGQDRQFHDRLDGLLPRLSDVRILRDVLAEDAADDDADRRVAGHLRTPAGGARAAEHAHRWWPLFAERPDLLAEFLGDDVDGYPTGAPGLRPEPGPLGYLDYDRWVDSPAVALTVLEQFPVAPEALVARLTALAVGRTRYRHAARRALATHPRAAELARKGLSDDDASVRASAAEWLAALGDTDVPAPEPGWELPAAVPGPVRGLPRAVVGHIDLFLQESTLQGIPRADVERWLALARPDVRLGAGWDGPVAARLGSPLMLPADASVPATVHDDGDVREHQLLATIDLSAIPPGATDLPLPPDGHLLLCANPDLEIYPEGSAVYVPAGAPVVERQTNYDWEPYEYDTPEDLDEDLRRAGELRVGHGYTLPDVTKELRAVHPRAEEIMYVWDGIPDTVGPAGGSGEWRLGGHAFDHEGWGDPAARSAALHEQTGRSEPGDWVLLAQWDGLPMASVYWTITREDLAERRFDRVEVCMYSNP
ncbi:hypothetical protein [Myceligenerans crystallogenes]|uniref:DUF1963 domain-containing protein n=1 Tax=Myceligenerans crystallogenes TaxID=316335 RepID=A0ABP4ZS98_9MICO